MVSSSLILLAASYIVVAAADDSVLKSLRQQFLRYRTARRALLSTKDFGPSVHVSNRVYLGTDKTKACGVEAKELIEADVGTDIIYCFKVTNDGSTYLNTIVLSNDDLSYSDTWDTPLAPGKSVEFTYSTSVVSATSTADQVNRANVRANPIAADGTDLGGDDVTYMDTSAVAVKSPYTSPLPATGCLQDAWKNGTSSTESLVCTSDKISIEPGSLTSTKTLTCIVGQTIRVNLEGKMSFSPYVGTPTMTYFDVGWHIATDGGDALTGTCAANGFHNENDYPYHNYNGMLSFNEENMMGKEDDACGDIVFFHEDDYTLEMQVPFGSVDVKCVDGNDDGKLDVKICLSWRYDDTDQHCDYKSNTLYPGAKDSCHCTTFDVPTITVEKAKACV